MARAATGSRSGHETAQRGCDGIENTALGQRETLHTWGQGKGEWWFLLKIPRGDIDGVQERHDGFYSQYRDATQTGWVK